MTFPPTSSSPQTPGSSGFAFDNTREVGDADTVEQSGDEVTTGGRVFGWVLALVIGAIFGTVGTVAHQITVTIFGAALPVGLVLGLIGMAALFVGVRLLLEDRVATVLSAVGVVGMIVLFSFRSAGGSVLIPQGLTGIVWSVVPALIAVVVISWPRNLGQSASRPAQNPGQRPPQNLSQNAAGPRPTAFGPRDSA